MRRLLLGERWNHGGFNVQGFSVLFSRSAGESEAGHLDQDMGILERTGINGQTWRGESLCKARPR